MGGCCCGSGECGREGASGPDKAGMVRTGLAAPAAGAGTSSVATAGERGDAAGLGEPSETSSIVARSSRGGCVKDGGASFSAPHDCSTSLMEPARSRPPFSASPEKRNDAISSTPSVTSRPPAPSSSVQESSESDAPGEASAECGERRGTDSAVMSGSGAASPCESPPPSCSYAPSASSTCEASGADTRASPPPGHRRPCQSHHRWAPGAFLWPPGRRGRAGRRPGKRDPPQP